MHPLRVSYTQLKTVILLTVLQINAYDQNQCKAFVWDNKKPEINP